MTYVSSQMIGAFIKARGDAVAEVNLHYRNPKSPRTALEMEFHVVEEGLMAALKHYHPINAPDPVREELVAIVKDLQFPVKAGGCAFCYYCLRGSYQGHTDTCRIRAALAKAGK